MRKFRRFLFLALPMLAGAGPAGAQRPELQVLAGAAMNGARAPGSPTVYRALLLPRLGLGLRIPLTARIALLTGLDAQQKGFAARSYIDDGEPGNYTIVNGRYQYSQLHLPLQVAVTLHSTAAWGLECNGGMSYGFMVSAKGEQRWEFYRSGRLNVTDEVPVRPRIALMPYDNRVVTPNPWNYGAMALFNPAAAFSVTLRVRKHLLVHAFAEYNLYDAASLSRYQTNLYSLGLCAGYRL